jgi:methylated-DNA-[protein]-cysteine S-methyltransferase
MADRATSIRNSFCLFPTAIGACAIAWTDRGVTSVWLPEQTEHQTRARVIRRFPDSIESAPPPFITHAIGGIVALLQGEARDLTDIQLDFDDAVPEFHRRVYDVTRTIRPGTTLSYGEVAERVGEPDAARAVGQALGRNPIPIIVPCHRVLAAKGGTGGFSAPGGTATKLQLLAIEGERLL